MNCFTRAKSCSDPEAYIRRRPISLQRLGILTRESNTNRRMTNSSRQLTPSGSLRSNQTSRSNPVPCSYQSNHRTHSTNETTFLQDGAYADSPIIEYAENRLLSSSYQSSIASSEYYTGFNNGPITFWKPGDHGSSIGGGASITRPKTLMEQCEFGSSQSVVCVDISDLNGDDEALATTQSILVCKSSVLKPYKRVQLLIGWRPFRKEKETFSLKRWQFINFFYPILITSLILYYDIIQGATCQGKLNIIADTKPKKLQPAQRYTAGNNSTGYVGVNEPIDYPESPMCHHLVPTYVIPSLLHLIAFIYGFYHFRISENEQLYSLMERVFIRTRNSIGTHDVIIRNSRRFRYALFGWLCLHLALELLYNFAYGTETRVLSKVISFENLGLLIFLLTLKTAGLILVHAVNIAVILNYCTQCEMLIMYIKDINLWLREKSKDLKLVMHEILRVREFISVLNGTMGKMTALCVVNYLEMTLIGLCLLFLNKDDDVLVWCYRSLYIIIWLIAFIIPLIQGARLSKMGQRLRQTSFEMRVFGYQNSSQLDLDSFILFVNSATLRAKLFGIAIRPALLLITLGGFFFILSMLLIGEVISIGPNKNLF